MTGFKRRAIAYECDIDHGSTVAYGGHVWTVIQMWDTVYNHAGLLIMRQVNDHGDSEWTMTFSHQVELTA